MRDVSLSDTGYAVHFHHVLMLLWHVWKKTFRAVMFIFFEVLIISEMSLRASVNCSVDTWS